MTDRAFLREFAEELREYEKSLFERREISEASAGQLVERLIKRRSELSERLPAGSSDTADDLRGPLLAGLVQAMTTGRALEESAAGRQNWPRGGAARRRASQDHFETQYRLAVSCGDLAAKATQLAQLGEVAGALQARRVVSLAVSKRNDTRRGA